MNKIYPLCVLFLLAPAIGELLSGSAPPAEFFTPPGFIVLSPIQEFDTSRADNTTGMTIVGMAALAFLLWIWWLIRRRLSPARKN